MSRRVPWWAILALGILCLITGIILAVRPFRSLAVMVLLIATSLLLTGISRMLSARASERRGLVVLVVIAWMLTGCATLAFPGLTIQALTLVVGGILLLSGLSQFVAAWQRRNDERLLLLLGGLANLLFGLLAWAAPAATVLVLALLFGVYVALLGVRQIALALRLRAAAPDARPTNARAWPRAWRLLGAGTSLIIALIGVGLSVSTRLAQPGAPGPFYSAPVPLPDDPPGTLIRSEVVKGFYTGATTYRVLYTSIGYDGKPAAVSGLIIVPDAPAPPQGRNIVAWTHGTVGVASNCAPSLIAPSIYAPALPALADFMQAGYIVAATDYQGLGTPGPHPYLVGASEGMNALDSVRAAINLPNAHASSNFVVWGESQGGHAALFTGQLAATYAPELRLRGVVASAPAADLRDLFKTKIEQSDAVGNMLISMATASWTRVYDTIDLDQVVFPAARSLVTSIADNCIQNPTQIQASLAPSSLLTMLFFSRPPTEIEAWNAIIAENTPGSARTLAPMLIAQGQIDQVIAPAVQARFVEKLCAAGDTVEYRTYPGVGHLTIAHDTASEVVQWIAARFAGVAPATPCS